MATGDPSIGKVKVSSNLNPNVGGYIGTGGWTTGYVNVKEKKTLTPKMKSFIIGLSRMKENNPDEYDKLVESTANMYVDPLLKGIQNTNVVPQDIDNADTLSELMQIDMYDAVLKAFFEDIQERCNKNGTQTAKETFNPLTIRDYISVKDNSIKRAPEITLEPSLYEELLKTTSIGPGTWETASNTIGVDSTGMVSLSSSSATLDTPYPVVTTLDERQDNSKYTRTGTKPITSRRSFQAKTPHSVTHNVAT